MNDPLTPKERYDQFVKLINDPVGEWSPADIVKITYSHVMYEFWAYRESLVGNRRAKHGRAYNRYIDIIKFKYQLQDL